MAGPLDIQRPARGLLDLLGMQVTGQGPGQLEAAIAGSVELTDLYLLDRLQTLTFSTGVAIPGVGVANCGAASGPSAGFLRFVYSVDWYTPTAVAAAASIQTHLGVARQSSITNVCLLPGMESGLLAAGAVVSRGLWFERPLVMRPGDILAFRTMIYTGAPAVTPAGFLYYADVSI